MRTNTAVQGSQFNVKGLLKLLTLSFALLTAAGVAYAGGTGTATLVPATAPEGSVVTTTLTYTVPTGGFNVGAAVRVTLPQNWGPNLQTANSGSPGYVTVIASGSFTLTISTSSPSVTLTASNSIASGTSITFFFHQIFVSCPSVVGQNVGWQVFSSTDSTDTMASLPNPPTEAYGVGPAQWLTYVPWNPITVAAGTASTPIVVQVADSCNQPALLTSTMTVSVAGQTQNGTVDLGALFSMTVTSGVLVSAAPTLNFIVPIGSSTASFYYQTSTVGTNLDVATTYTSPQNGFNQTAARQVVSLASLPTFSAIAIDNGAPVVGQLTTLLSPDGDGINDNVFIRFTPSNLNLNWHVLISSNNFQTNVFEQFGFGNPQSTLNWGGHNQLNNTYPIVDNGTYQIKIEYPGLPADISLSAIVNTAAITGTVSIGGAVVAGAQINAQRTDGPGYSSTVSDANGHFVLNGVSNGHTYNLFAQAVSTVGQSVITGQLLSVTAPSTQAFLLQAPAILRIAVTTTNPAVQSAYGSINLHTSDYSLNYYGNIAIASGATTSTNGDTFNPSTWTVIYAKPGTYLMHVTLPGFGTVSADPLLTLVAGANADQTPSLVAKATISGQIILPTITSQANYFVPIEGIRQGNTFATVYGGATIAPGASSATYTLYSVDSGTYLFRARPPNYIPATTSAVVGTSDIANLNISGFSVGGTLSGTLIISGDTSQQPLPPLFVGVFSPSLGFNADTQVTIATSATTASATYQITGLPNGLYQLQPPYLNGFQTSSNLPQVTVANGVGTAPPLTLTADAGTLTGTITLPGGSVDYGNVDISIQGNTQAELHPTGPTYEFDHLGGGYYTVTATYLTSGAQLQTYTVITNGFSQNINLNLSAVTYGISGTVSVQSGFSMKTSTGSVVTINSITDLLANATNQALTLGGFPSYDFNNTITCQGGITSSVSAARVEAFPRTFNSSRDSNKNVPANCYSFGAYKYGVMDSSGNYAINGLTPGLWEVDVYPYFDGGSTPNVATVQQLVAVVGSTVTAINFQLANGNALSGTINLPSGVTDTRTFTAEVLDVLGNLIQKVTIQLGTSSSPSHSALYKFSNLPAGNYSLLILDPGSYDATLNQTVTKYVATPIQFTINGNDLVSQDVTMARSARIIGRLALQGTNTDGTISLMLITAANENLLPSNFFINSQSDTNGSGNGRSANFNSNTGGIALDGNNQFTIDGLSAGTYDVYFQGSSGGGTTSGINLANYTKGSITVTTGQTLDVGTIALLPGLSVSGTVKDHLGTGLSNIRIRAQSSNSQNGNNSTEVFTDALGNFTLSGLNPTIKIYDFTAAPRPDPGENVLPVPYGTTARLAIDITAVPSPVLNFVLPPATATLTGRVVTVDGGALSYADPDHGGFPAATVYVHQQGNTLEDNPLGKDTATGLDGSFSISNLPAGVYDLTLESLGYKALKLSNITVLDGSVQNLGMQTLLKGPSLVVTLARPDGSPVKTSDVQFAVAATPDLGNILFGQINQDANTGNILSIKFAGFNLGPATYSVMLFDSNSNITAPPEGQGIFFSADSDALVKTLTYIPSAPTALTHVLKVGSSVVITYYFTRPLRNRPDDQDPAQWMTIVAGNGTLSGYQLSGDRRQLSVTYTPPPDEPNATLKLDAHTGDIDLSTGVEFALSKTITLLLGQKATAEGLVSATLGGSISLSDSNDPANISVPANALLTSTGATVNNTTSFNVTFTATDDPNNLPSVVGSPVTAPALKSLMARGAAAYVSEAYLAMNSAQTQRINPLSSFYSILLPAGISHSLNQSALLTLSYDSTADPQQINIYYFDGTRYVLQSSARTIDTVNHTITVSVGHFSTFVVLSNNSPVVTVGGTSTAGASIDVFNFPNPFDLQPKIKNLTHGGGTASLSTDGTIIRYSVPAAYVGPAHITIYDTVGEKVRTIELGVPAADVENYIAWDGKNSSGHNVASGVYIGELSVGGQKRFWKMAVIK